MKNLRFIFFSIFIATFSCNHKKDEIIKEKKNDLTKLGIKGPIKHIKEVDFRCDFTFGKPVKQYPPTYTKNIYFNNEGLITRQVYISEKGFSSFVSNEYDDSNRLIKRIYSYDVDKIKSANYENDPNGTIWCYNKKIDTIIYSNNSKSVFSINNLSLPLLTNLSKYDEAGNIIEEIEYSENLPKKRTVFIYDDSSRVTSMFEYDSISTLSKTNYEYYSDRKITKIIDSNYHTNHPFIKTEYYDSTGVNLIKEVFDESGNIHLPYYWELTNEYDSLGNNIHSVVKPTNFPNSCIGIYQENKRHFYDFDAFGNWKKEEYFDYNSSSNDYVQKGITERTIEPFKELVKETQHKSLLNGWLLIILGIAPILTVLIVPRVLGGLTFFVSNVIGSSKALTNILIFLSGLISTLIYVLTASTYYLIVTLGFDKYDKYWWYSQLIATLVIFFMISLIDAFKELKNIKENTNYNSSNNIEQLYPYIGYSKSITKLFIFSLLVYYIFLFDGTLVNNVYFNSIRDFVLNHF